MTRLHRCLSSGRAWTALAALFLGAAARDPGLGIPGPADAVGARDSTAFAARLEERITGLMARHGYPGFSLSVTRGCDTVHAAGYGVADRDARSPATSATVYQVGSVTKMFTGLVLATLVAEGVVELGDPLARHLPDSVSAPTDSTGATITIQHLALHLAGLSRYPANLERDDGDPILGYSTADLYAELGRGSLEWDVGSRWAYSNYGYGVLGHALERATGTSLEALVRDRITAPLGMSHTVFERDRIEQDLAIPYRDDEPAAPTRPWEMGELRAAGGLYSTAGDLARFVAFHLGCGDEELPAALRAGRDLAAVPFHRFPSAPEWAYGLGRFVIDDPELGRLLMHGGDLDGYAAYVTIATDRNVGMAFLTNRGIGAPLGELGEWLLEEAVAEFGEPGPGREPGDG